MSDATRQLARLRREIDAVDDALHDLVLRRAELTRAISKVKKAQGQGRSFLRPGREARILRRLVERHNGRFPTGALVRLWRELLCAMLPVQGAFSVVVAGDSIELWDTARDFYGSDTRMRRVPGAGAAVTAVIDGSDSLAVLAADEEAAWRALLAEGERGPFVTTRLPFAVMRRGAGPRRSAFVVARDRADESGDDVTVLALESEADPRPPLRDAGFEIVAAQGWPGLWQVDIAGRHDGGDGRRLAIGALTARLLGACPAPLTALPDGEAS